MSKIGRKPIDLGSVQVEVKGQEVHYKGKKVSGVHNLPDFIEAKIEGKLLTLTIKESYKAHLSARDINCMWGLNRALLANKIRGAEQDFERVIQINGLGFKAASSGNKLVFSLGFTHKIDFVLPSSVGVEIDKTGQRLVFKSSDKEQLGLITSKVRALRPPEPYKGTGVKYEAEVIKRKAGKAKAAAA